MKLLKKIWTWLDGKKTMLGTVLFILGEGLQYFSDSFLTGIWHLAPIPHLTQIIASLNWFATVLGGTGLLHKGVKSAAADAVNTILDNAKSVSQPQS